jgi:ABC-2 type transport system permease protein
MLRFLVEKEFKQLFRNPFLPRLIVMFPLMALLVLPLAASFDVHNLNLAVVDRDLSPASRRLAAKAVASGYFRLVAQAPDYGAALKAVELGDADLILEIPSGFERDLRGAGTGSVLIAADNVNAAKGGLGSAYLSRIVSDFASELGRETAAAAAASGPEIIPRFRYNPRLRYPVQMVPALMAMVLTMICGFLPALNIVSEKESGTIEQMNVTPVRRFDFILAKLIPYWVVGFVVLSICFVIARLAYGLAPAGSLATIYLFAAVFILAISGAGLVISNYAQTIQQAMFMMFFFVITFILLSGLYTPVESMPAWARRISDFSPLYYLIRTMRMVYLKGSGISELTDSLAALGAFALFFNAWAIASYRKRN